MPVAKKQKSAMEVALLPASAQQLVAERLVSSLKLTLNENGRLDQNNLTLDIYVPLPAGTSPLQFNSASVFTQVRASACRTPNLRRQISPGVMNSVLQVGRLIAPCISA